MASARVQPGGPSLRPAAALAWPARLGPMTWFLTILGIIALIVLHELGHFAVAKAVGMRVERFSLFFPPTIFRRPAGETEYAIGAIPAGGYVKITGMNPEELKDLEPEVARRAYYAQPPWKRIVVILAGPRREHPDRLPAVLGGAAQRQPQRGRGLAQPRPIGLKPQPRRRSRKWSAANRPRRLRPGDRIVAVEGRHGDGRAGRCGDQRPPLRGPAGEGCRARHAGAPHGAPRRP